MYNWQLSQNEQVLTPEQAAELFGAAWASTVMSGPAAMPVIREIERKITAPGVEVRYTGAAIVVSNLSPLDAAVFMDIYSQIFERAFVGIFGREISINFLSGARL